ncbi:MAG: ABC transporter ATP-binding protein, partial [Actinomycetota bacterium]|nr:ABC transporter ATP-binding protein [Actinomycetota bacterium]
MSFAYPWLLLLLVPLAMGVMWWVWRDRRGVTNRAAIPFADLDLVAMATPRRRSTRWLPGM